MTRKVLLIILIAVIGFSFWSIFHKRTSDLFPFPKNFVKKQHVFDEAGILPSYDIGKFEQYLNYIFNESDIDIRFVFVHNTGNKTLEELAIDKMQGLGIGKENKEERGLLCLYDLKDKRLRIEVGYGLEAYFPDGFVSYLVEQHTKDFFASKDVTAGLRLLLRMFHHRIREAILKRDFDPKVTEILKHQGYLSGGAGVSKKIPENGGKKEGLPPALSDRERYRYGPQASPEEAYLTYIQWLIAGQYDPRVDIFTTDSQRYMASLPMTRAYFHYILLQEYGRKYEASIRDNLALLYFVDDPLACPHFFIKDDRGWQMDIVAEVRNTKDIVGGIYIWDYRGQDDIYTRTFKDKLVNIKNYIRIADGDNRELPIRRTSREKR